MTRGLVDQEFHKGDVVRIIEEGNKYYGFKATVKYSSTYGDGYDLTLEDGTYASTEQYGVEAWKDTFKPGDMVESIRYPGTPREVAQAFPDGGPKGIEPYIIYADAIDSWDRMKDLFKSKPKEDIVTEFKVGDRIIAIEGEPPYFYKNDTGTVTRVGSLRDSLKVEFDKKHQDGIWYIPTDKAKLLTEPAEEPTEEPADAPVTPEEDEWWTVEDPRDVVMPEEVERAASFGLEIRVQVRRKL